MFGPVPIVQNVAGQSSRHYLFLKGMILWLNLQMPIP
nr:MAG TPA: hypothetical protein [Caudoviricetes sp.]DAK01021.1 MAG TPA: hypothetical protein [Caudoviricetes sp.]DAK95256.1 MAG TPA: hypothetical protein [Caudoviricetes sp.]DAN35200.1 MAG TPA: hypothetical protein [Caudoviricetes sp.]DAP93373.1 MAG TPA: hypothetical protein [Caudoviricetes sp.]